MQNEQSSNPQAKASDFLNPPVQAVQNQTENTPVSPSLPTATAGATPPPEKRFSIKTSGILKIIVGLISVLVIIALVYLIATRFLGGASKEITLNLWGIWEDGKTMQAVIADFERQNPNVKVTYSKQDLKQYKDRLLARSQNDNRPDTFLFHNTWKEVLSEILLPVPESVMSKQDFEKNYYNVIKKDLAPKGAIYGIPSNIDTLVMFVNKDLFSATGSEIPANWNDFIDTARGLTVKDEEGKIITSGAALGTYENVTHAPDIVSLLFLQNGVNIKNLDATSDRAIGALNFYTAFALDENNVWNASEEPSIVKFSAGKLAMYFGYSWDYYDIKAANPNINLQIVPVPQLGDEPINLASYWAWGANLKSKNQKEALALLKLLTSKETQMKLYSEEAKGREFGEPYPRVDLAESLKDTVIYPVVLQAAYADSSFLVDAAGDNGINKELNSYLENAVNSINTGTSVESAFDTFKQGVFQVLEKYGQQ
ncbi:MAG: hypothetical protein A2798_01445 [Candidatus Levybacteria bacterium RIFCSPHIGHO2_01_FULL_37_17]|nr:MAG: hypothetical protein A2798_01445 [Candidatus Levybacteria bacterium RIFCSPHIGHO2_01_FULL_37_17]OGH37113.1 MAG: hypothetical protein A2959_02305 [Candidatus Levybacteria bacterium RIFCSPLOWO2_01_FULL_38_23]